MENKRNRDQVEPEKLPSDELLAIIQEIVDEKGNSKDKQRIIRKKYPAFVDGYPTLFEMATKPGFDFERFKYMLQLKDSVEQNNLSQYDASAKVGQMLYNVYVKDKIDQIPPASQK
jgi:hypothetical protein